MNILPFLIAILLVLSYSTSGLIKKHRLSSQNHAAYLGLRRAERALLRKSEFALYKQLPGISKPIQSRPEKKPAKEKKIASLPPLNPACARLNLFPLLVDGNQAHQQLYTYALKLLDLFYGKTLFDQTPYTAKKFLDALLSSARKQLTAKKSIPLETLALEESKLQLLYYSALKGTKRCTLGSRGFPPLIDFFIFNSTPSPVCVFHAHPHMLSLFFGPKNGHFLYQKLHTEPKSSITPETLPLLIDLPERPFLDPETWALLSLHSSNHPSQNSFSEPLIAEDATTGISLRRKISR